MQAKRKVWGREDSERFHEDVCDGFVPSEMGVKLVPIPRGKSFSIGLERTIDCRGYKTCLSDRANRLASLDKE
jgi:hypothetical protein